SKSAACLPTGCLFQNWPHYVVGGTWDDGALHYHHMVGLFLSQGGANLGRTGANVGEIDSIPIKRRAYGNQGEAALTHRFIKVGGCAQAPVDDLSLQELRKSRLVNGRFAGVYLIHLILIKIDANHRVILFG